MMRKEELAKLLDGQEVKSIKYAQVVMYSNGAIFGADRKVINANPTCRDLQGLFDELFEQEIGYGEMERIAEEFNLPRPAKIELPPDDYCPRRGTFLQAYKTVELTCPDQRCLHDITVKTGIGAGLPTNITCPKCRTEINLAATIGAVACLDRQETVE